LRELSRKLNADDPEFRPWGISPVGVTAPWLHARTLVVHAVDIDGSDFADLKTAGCTVVLCPRSNRHISGSTPDLPRLLEAGIPLAIGTDSLASSPSLAPLSELQVLRKAYPFIAAGRLLALAWNGAAVGAPQVGHIEAGRSPGILAAPLHGARPLKPLDWLLETAPDRAPFFSWIAQARAHAGDA
jgi:cytosine/adenosine deaminase-related metal-dependent hydrolase